MAQDKKKALDDKTKKLWGKRIEEGKEHAAYQEAQQQLLAIQAEQQQNLAVARAESKASFENNQTLAQAAELGAISASEAEQMAQAGGQQVNLNPATQQILNKYGAGQPRFQRSQSHSQQVTKQNITINNNITSNTTNDVKVPGGIGGPIQGRPLQFKSPGQQDSTGKFKAWISSAFARQNEEGARRDREYRQRESSLTRSASRMMKKLEDVGKTIGTRMDPRKIGSTWQSQLKTLLLLFGFGYLTSNWTKVLDKVSSIEEWVRNTWGYFSGENKETNFLSDIKTFIGGDGKESIVESLGKLLGNEGLFGYIKEYFNKIYQDRAQAVKEVKFPKIDTSSIFNTLESLGEYLGDLFGAITGGTESVKKTVAKQVEKEALGNSMKNYQDHGRTATTETIEIGDFKGDKGTLSLLDGSYRGLTAYSIDKEGNLDKNNLTEATLAASSEISRVKGLLDKGDLSQTSSLVQQLNRLYTTAKETKNNYVAVTDEFINSLTRDELRDLTSRKLIQRANYRVVYKNKSKEDLDNRENLDPTRRAADMYATQYAAYGIGGRLGSLATENYSSAIFGDWGAPIASATEYGLTALDRYLANDGRFILVRKGEKLKPGEQDTGKTKVVYEISPEGIKMITNRLANRELDDEIYLDDKPRLQRVFENKKIDEQLFKLDKLEEKTRNKLDQVNQSSIDNQANSIYPYRLENNLAKIDELRESLYNYSTGGYSAAGYTVENLTAGKDKIDAEFEANTEGNRFVTFTENVSDKIYSTTDGRYGSRKLTVDQKDRSKYAMKRLMEEGLNKEQAAGIVGNMIKESGLDPTLGHTDINGLHAGGIVQWNGPRYDTAKRYFGKPVEQVSFEDQFEYLIKELKGEVGDGAQERNGFLKKHGFKRGDAVLDVMKTTTSLQDSTDTFERIFEGSGDFEGYWTNKGKPNAQFHEGDRNKSRHDLAASVYKNAGGDLSNIKFVEYEDQKKESEEKVEEESFISILGKHIKEFIFNMGGLLGKVNDKVEEITSPVMEGAKKAIFKNGGKYGGPITDQFTDYNSYLANQDVLPDGLPAGLSYTEWKNRVYDITGSMPSNLDTTMSTTDYRTNQIISKYSKDYIEKPEAEVIKPESPKVENPEVISQNMIDIFDPDTYKKRDEWIESIDDHVLMMLASLNKLVDINAITGTSTAKVVDAVNNNTFASVQSSRQLAQANQAQIKNATEKSESLKDKSNNLV